MFSSTTGVLSRTGVGAGVGAGVGVAVACGATAEGGAVEEKLVMPPWLLPQAANEMLKKIQRLKAALRRKNSRTNATSLCGYFIGWDKVIVL